MDKKDGQKVSVEEAKKYLIEKAKSDSPAGVCRTTGELAYFTDTEIDSIDGSEDFTWEYVQGCSDLEPSCFILRFKDADGKVYVG